MLLAELLSDRVVTFSFGGREWPLLFTHRALLLCQKETHIDTLNAANLGKPSASLLRGLLYGALSAAGASCSISDVGACFTFTTIEGIRRKVIEAWIASMAVPKPKKAKPTDKDAKPKEPLTWMESWAEATSKHGFGLTDDQWLDMTPRQVAHLQDFRLRQQQREEVLVGMIAATVQNHSASPPKKAASPKQFMLHPYEEDEEEENLSLGDQMAAAFAKFGAGGEAALPASMARNKTTGEIVPDPPVAPEPPAPIPDRRAHTPRII